MGKPKLFSLQLNHPQCLYTPGDVMSGKVTLELEKEMKMRGVRLELLGQAIVLWREGSNKHRRTYKAVETYFNEAIGLFGSSSDSQVVKPGLYTYPFTFTLARNLPASFKSHVGNIGYRAKAVVDIPFGFDHTAVMDFTILPFLDLNLENPLLRHPTMIQKHETLSCCGASGLVEVDLVINRLCFVPGETIVLSGTIKNNTNRKISSIKAVLLQNLQFHAGAKSHTWTWNEIGSAFRPDIASKDTDTIDRLPIVIPPTPPSRLDGCRIIDIFYHLKIVAKMTCNDVVLSNEIILGTVPLLGTQPLPIMQQPPLLPMATGMPPAPGMPMATGKPMTSQATPQQPGQPLYPALHPGQPQQLPGQNQGQHPGQPMQQQQQPVVQRQPVSNNKQNQPAASTRTGGQVDRSNSRGGGDQGLHRGYGENPDRGGGNQPGVHGSGRNSSSKKAWNDV